MNIRIKMKFFTESGPVLAGLPPRHKLRHQNDIISPRTVRRQPPVQAIHVVRLNMILSLLKIQHRNPFNQPAIL